MIDNKAWGFPKFNDLLGTAYGSTQQEVALAGAGITFIDPYIIAGMALLQDVLAEENRSLVLQECEPSVASYLRRMNFPYRENRELLPPESHEESPVLLELFRIRDKKDGDTVARHVLHSLQDRLGYPRDLAHNVFNALSEAFQNSLEHAHSAPFVIMQIFKRQDPGHQRLVLCVLDRGQGILSSLKKNPKYGHLTEDRQAVELALQKGVSGVFTDHTRGQGLWRLQDICKRYGGRFILHSGASQVYIKAGEPFHWYSSPFIPGTQLRLELRPV